MNYSTDYIHSLDIANSIIAQLREECHQQAQEIGNLNEKIALYRKAIDEALTSIDGILS
jgi:hypothetical protein